MPRDDLYLFEIVEAADRVSDFLHGVDVDAWNHSELVRSAVLQKLTTIGEATRALEPTVKERHPEVPWSRVVAFRNVAVHEYFAVEWTAVWYIARNDLPGLREQALRVLRAEYPDIARRYDERD